MNKFGVPVNYNGYYKYDLSNYRIKPDVYYTLKSDVEGSQYVISNTSVDINIETINPDSMRKAKLYNNLNNKRIALL